MVELRSFTQMRWIPFGVARSVPCAPFPVLTMVEKTGFSPW
jgi:hypothetical protein